MAPAKQTTRYGLHFVSGVHIRTPDPAHVDALVKVVLELAQNSVWVIDLFPLLELAHWDAYARLAGIPNPDKPTRIAARAAIRKHFGYVGPSDPDDQ